jgi:hypothetical protein
VAATNLTVPIAFDRLLVVAVPALETTRVYVPNGLHTIPRLATLGAAACGVDVGRVEHLIEFCS